MKIETKYDIGQWVYFMLENKVAMGEITRIELRIEKEKGVDTKYIVEYCHTPYTHYEYHLYPTKEELLKSL